MGQQVTKTVTKTFRFSPFMFCTTQNPRFLIKMDDDTQIDYDHVAASLEYEDTQHPGELNILCPSVFRNQKLWTHQAAPIMGKWAYMNENYTDFSELDTIAPLPAHNNVPRQGTICRTIVTETFTLFLPE